MQKLRLACFWCLRKVWQIFAVSLVLIAVVVSVLKYTLPYANDYKTDIESILTEQLNTDIGIGSISASWEHTGPALVLNDLSFASGQDVALTLYIVQSRLHFNLWESFLQRRLVSNYFVLSGLDAEVNLNYLEPTNDTEDDDTDLVDVLETLFLADSGHFAIKDSQFSIITKNNEQRVIALDRITWQSRDNKHQGVGYISLPGISDNRLELILDLYGDHFADSSGNFYISTKQLNASSWLKDVISPDISKVKSDINLEAWGSFADLQLQNIQLQWLPSKIDWQKETTTESIQIHNAEVRVNPTELGWTIETSELSLSSGQSKWPSFGGKLTFNNQAITAHWQNLPLNLISAVSPLLPFEQTDFLEQLTLSGQASNVYLDYQAADNFFLQAAVNSLSWQPFQGIPGGRNLTADILANHSAAKLHIHGDDDYFITNDLFTKPLSYKKVDISVDLIKQAQGWTLQSDNIWLHNDDLTFAAEFSLDLFEQAELSLYAEMNGPEATLAQHYFPYGYMSQNTIEYLTDALRGGRVDIAKVLWQGKLSDFPYRDNDGRFLVDASIVDAKFNFNSDWPDINGLNASLIFSNERMDILSYSGNLAGLELEQSVRVSIDDLSISDWLNVDINTQQEAKILQPFFAKTPLKDSVGSVLEVVQGSGDVDVTSRIRVPLGEEQEVDVKGKVEFDNTPIYIASPGVLFDKVSGTLIFENSDITLKNAQSTWLDMPFDFTLTGRPNKQNYDISLNGNGNWKVTDIVNNTQGMMAGFLSGEVPIDIAFDMQLKEQGFSYTASANSNLVGFISQLPTPYAKTSKQTWPLSFNVRGDELSNLVIANINEQLYFNSIIDNEQGKVTHAHLIIGQQDLGLNASGFDVTVQLDKADVMQWIPFIEHLITTPTESSDSNSLFPPLKKVDAYINTAQVAGTEFNDLEINLLSLAQSTQLNFNGREIRAEVSIPKVLAQRPVFIETDYLRLNIKSAEEGAGETQSGNISDNISAKKSDTQDPSWLKNLPAIRFACTDCKINNYQLDKVKLDLDPADDGVLISQLNIDKGKHQFVAKGSWQQQKTNLTGKLTSKDIGELADEFDIISTIEESNADINIDLSWHGVPYQFNTETLSGELKFRLGDGYISDVSDGGARVFSLLSLDSLVRKLKLDFRDVFSKGFFYNSMKGSIQVDNGVAYTQDAQLNGVPADLTVMGYTDLNTQKIDYTMWVAPQVTSSIPVIVAWLVNPVTGLAALAIDQVLHSARVISEIEYTITGTLDEPVVTEKAKKSREIELPKADVNGLKDTQLNNEDTPDTEFTEAKEEDISSVTAPLTAPVTASIPPPATLPEDEPLRESTQ